MTAAEEILQALKLVIGKDVNEYAIPVLNTIIKKHESEQISSKEQECQRLRTTLVAGAELIKENWSKLCDEDGYGPQNLLLRMDGTLNTSGYPGYSSGEFEKLRKRCEDLEAACRKVIDPNDDFDTGIDEIKKLLSQ